MKLPIPFLKNKKPDSGYYLALLLTDDKISSVIIEEKFGKAKIISKHHEHLSQSLENLSQDELISLTDKTISRAEEILPPNIETHKTVFGVKENWIEADTKKIKKEHLAKLKKVCDALDLTPIGFMVISEAIANLIQSEEGAPLSAIVVELGKKTVYATLFRGGQISETASGQVEHSLPAAVDTLLKQFTAPVLPAKIILSASTDEKNIAQHFIKYEWSKSLPFLHLPQISTLPADFDTKAVAVGAANQLGLEMLELEGTALQKPTVNLDEANSPQADIPKTDYSQSGVSVNDFGFLNEQDIAESDIRELSPAKIPLEAPTPDLMPEKTNVKAVDDNMQLIDAADNYNQEIDQYDTAEITPSKASRSFQGLFTRIPKIQLPKNFKLPNSIKNKKMILPLIIIGSFAVLLLFLIFYYFYNVKADIVLSVKPKEVTHTEEIKFSTTSANNLSQKIIAGKTISTTINGEAVTNTTGKKDTGNKAKGSVTVYNNSKSKASLNSGTTIKSSNDLVFTFDKDIEVASASGDDFTGTKPGTTNVNVTASEIGTESNLPSGTKFTIGGNSSLAAKNDNAFSGGSKKTLNVVSKTDIAKLRTEIIQKLEKDAEEEFKKSKKTGESILPIIIDSKLEDEEFDKDVNEEAKQVTLKASVAFEGISYSDEDLENFDKSILKEKYSEDIAFAQTGLKNEVTDIAIQKDKTISAKLKITAGLLPKISTNEVISKLKNKSPNEASDLLKTLPQVTNSEIKFSPNLFFVSRIFPKLPKNINIILQSE